MKLNRRSVLGAIGMVGVGTGAAFGSGAFTTVEAQREVEVNVIGGDFVSDGIIHLAPDPLDDVDGNKAAVDADGNEYPDGNSIETVEQTISSEIIGRDGTADVLVNTESDFITVKDANDTEFDGRSLYPTLDDTYDSTDGSYVSLVANDVTIVFGPEGRKLPANSKLEESKLFGVVRNGNVDVTFSKGTDNKGLLTKVGGTNVTDDPTTNTGNKTLSGQVQTKEASRETEDLIITIGDDGQ